VCAHIDIYKSGDCKTCDRDRNDRYRRRRRLGMSMLHAAESRGLSGGEAIALIQNADYDTLQECQSRGIR
jgi:hypothetical protein